MMDLTAVRLYETFKRSRPNVPPDLLWKEAQDASAVVVALATGVAEVFAEEERRLADAKRAKRQLIMTGLRQKRARRDASRARYIESKY